MSLSRCGVTLFCLSLSEGAAEARNILVRRIGAVEPLGSANEASRIALEP